MSRIFMTILICGINTTEKPSEKFGNLLYLCLAAAKWLRRFFSVVLIPQNKIFFKSS